MATAASIALPPCSRILAPASAPYGLAAVTTPPRNGVLVAVSDWVSACRVTDIVSTPLSAWADTAMPPASNTEAQQRAWCRNRSFKECMFILLGFGIKALLMQVGSRNRVHAWSFANYARIGISFQPRSDQRDTTGVRWRPSFARNVASARLSSVERMTNACA